MQLRTLAPIVALALLTGCAATVKRSSADTAMTALPPSAAAKLVLNVGGAPAAVNAGDWSGFKLEWTENFAAQAKLAGLPFETQDGPARPTGEDGTLLVVHIDDYRFLRPGTRYGLGVMTGNAYIESKLTFRSLKTGETYGTRAANTSSSAWEGVFSAMTNKQVEAIAAEAVKAVKGRK